MEVVGGGGGQWLGGGSQCRRGRWWCLPLIWKTTRRSIRRRNRARLNLA